VKYIISVTIRTTVGPWCDVIQLEQLCLSGRRGICALYGISIWCTF